MIPVCRNRDCSNECFTCKQEVDDVHAVIQVQNADGHKETRTFHLRDECFGELKKVQHLVHHLDGHTYWANYQSERKPRHLQGNAKQSVDSPGAQLSPEQTDQSQPEDQQPQPPAQPDSIAEEPEQPNDLGNQQPA